MHFRPPNRQHHSTIAQDGNPLTLKRGLDVTRPFAVIVISKNRQHFYLRLQRAKQRSKIIHRREGRIHKIPQKHHHVWL